MRIFFVSLSLSGVILLGKAELTFYFIPMEI